MFPKIIHQIWLQGDKNLSNENKIKCEKIKELHNNYDYILWDEIQILKLISNDQNLINIYYRFEYMHQRIDFAKYIILEKIGGVYIDIDVEVIKSIDSLLEDNKEYDLIVSKLIVENYLEKKITCNNDEYCLNNGIIIGKQNSDVLINLIDNILKNNECNLYDMKIICINNTTGPKFITQFLSTYRGSSKILFLDYEYLEPCLGNICKKTKKTIMMHKHNLSWFDKRYKNIFKYYLNNKKKCYLIFFIILFIIILKF